MTHGHESPDIPQVWLDVMEVRFVRIADLSSEPGLDKSNVTTPIFISGDLLNLIMEWRDCLRCGESHLTRTGTARVGAVRCNSRTSCGRQGFHLHDLPNDLRGPVISPDVPFFAGCGGRHVETPVQGEMLGADGDLMIFPPGLMVTMVNWPVLGESHFAFGTVGQHAKSRKGPAVSVAVLRLCDQRRYPAWAGVA